VEQGHSQGEGRGILATALLKRISKRREEDENENKGRKLKWEKMKIKEMKKG